MDISAVVARLKSDSGSDITIMVIKLIIKISILIINYLPIDFDAVIAIVLYFIIITILQKNNSCRSIYECIHAK